MKCLIKMGNANKHNIIFRSFRKYLVILSFHKIWIKVKKETIRLLACQLMG